MENYELLSDDDNIMLYKKNFNQQKDDKIEEFLFTFTCKEDLTECDIFEIIKGKQLFELIYSLNNNIITNFETIQDDAILLKLKEININHESDGEDQNKKFFLCLKEDIDCVDENNLTIEYSNFDHQIEDFKQIIIDKFIVTIKRSNDQVKFDILINCKTDIEDISIIDNEAHMIVLTLFFKNLKQYIEP